MFLLVQQTFQVYQLYVLGSSRHVLQGSSRKCLGLALVSSTGFIPQEETRPVDHSIGAEKQCFLATNQNAEDHSYKKVKGSQDDLSQQAQCLRSLIFHFQIIPLIVLELYYITFEPERNYLPIPSLVLGLPPSFLQPGKYFLTRVVRKPNISILTIY